uniref:Ribose-5-phosphate isomerase n=1 Tax=Mesocestoides corti TaxID=53468 RepID=A0A5K3G2V3_MESCO
MSDICPAERTLNLKPSAWQELNDAINKEKAINLGLGSSGFIFTNRILKSLRCVADDNVSPSLHQYARSQGHPRLVTALAKLFNERFRHNACVSGEIPEDLRE